MSIPLALLGPSTLFLTIRAIAIQTQNKAVMKMTSCIEVGPMPEPDPSASSNVFAVGIIRKHATEAKQ
jgi:hypothetical protein